MLPDSEYSPVSLSLRQGERLVIYTDGLVESAEDSQARTLLESKILGAIKDSSEMPLERASRYVMQVFDDLAGSPPKDDTTFIMLEANSSPTEAIHAR